MKNTIPILSLFLVFTCMSQAQEIISDGFLPSRKTTTARLAMAANIADGTQIYDTDLHAIFYWDAEGGTSGEWKQVADTSVSNNLYNSNGSLTGNRTVTQNNFDVNFDANTLVVDGSANRVGVGTNAPSHAFHVQGGTRLTNITNGAANISSNDLGLYGQDPARHMRFANPHRIQFYTDGAAANGFIGAVPALSIFRDNSVTTAGVFQIGSLPTGAASDQIVTADANGNLRKRAASSLATNNIYNSNGTLTGNRAITQGNFDLNFEANTLVIDGGLNSVGVNTNTPRSLFDVNGVATIGASTYQGSNIEIGIENNTTAKNSFIDFHSDATASDYDARLIRWGLENNDRLDLFNRGGSIRIQSLTDYVELQGTGVGVNTATPTHPFHVNGKARIQNITNGAATIGTGDLGLYGQTTSWMRMANANGRISFFTDGAAANNFIGDEPTMVVRENNRVGIATAEPEATLDVRGSALFNQDNANADFKIGTITGDEAFVVHGTGVTGVVVNEGGLPNVDFRVETNSNTSAFYVGSLSNNVHVNFSRSTSTDFRVGSISTNDMLHVDASSNRVGINTGTPQAAFHVNGSVRLQGLNGGSEANDVVTREGDGDLETESFEDVARYGTRSGRIRLNDVVESSASNGSLTRFGNFTNATQTYDNSVKVTRITVNFLTMGSTNYIPSVIPGLGIGDIQPAALTDLEFYVSQRNITSCTITLKDTGIENQNGIDLYITLTPH